MRLNRWCKRLIVVSREGTKKNDKEMAVRVLLRAYRQDDVPGVKLPGDNRFEVLADLLSIHQRVVAESTQ